MKSLGLKSIGLWLASVPFHFGLELVEWKPKFGVSRGDLELKLENLVEIYDEVEEEQLDVFGP